MIFDKNEIKAAGILMYNIIDDKIFLLLRQQKEQGYADFGGKIEKTDKYPEDIAIREAVEESNGVFTKEAIEKVLSHRKYYISNCKYLIHFAKIDYIPTDKFGTRESYSDVKHCVQWFCEDEIHTVKLHIRLGQIRNFIKIIRDIEHKKQENRTMNFD